MGSVLAVQPRRHIRQPQRLRAQPAGQLLAALERAVGHGHGLGAARGEVRGDQLDHLARADEQHVQLIERAEELHRLAHGRGGHADGVRADLGGRAHFLGDRERALEELVQRGAERAGRIGLAHGLLHLAEDLGLAQHHRIEAGGHAEHVARGIAVLEHVAVVEQLAARDAALRGQPFGHRAHQRAGLVARELPGIGRDVELGAVAGGQQRHLGRRAAELRGQRLQRRHQTIGREREAPPEIDGGGLVVEAERDDRHGTRF
jgi:hypothetical protein